MLKHIFLLACLPLLLFANSISDDKFSISPPPEWVEACDFSREVVSIKPFQVNFQNLLMDVQSNWEEKTRYFHMAVKVLNQAGAEKASQFTIDFDPSYQTVAMHTLRVLRNGKSLDRLKSRHKIIQREEDLERNLYNGDYTVVYFLNDIREGDIIEYAWSITGAHPLFSTHFYDVAMLQNREVVERLYRRILIHPSRSLTLKSFNTAIEPQVRDLSPTLREWSWELTEIPRPPSDPWQPSWYNPYARVQLTEYQSWNEVVRTIAPLYNLPEEFLKNPLSDMVALTDAWKEASDPVKQALLALRFVQDEVRYLGFEDGIGSHQPTDPHTVFQRRFGDCKDKTVLLKALLHLMGIPSTPILVHTGIGRRLNEYLPTPHSFNHAVLRIEIGDKCYYVDPTYTLQGGSLSTTYFPELFWGLPVAEEATGLIPLPPPPSEIITRINTSITVSSRDTAHLNITKVHSGFKADYMRRVMIRKGAKRLSDEYLESVQKQYKGASILSPLKVSDDRGNNVVIVSESYRIPIRTSRGKKFLKVSSDLIDDYLDDSINLERTSPYALAYPHWITEHIRIENPFNDWPLESEEIKLEHESVVYSYSMKKEGHTADFDLELKHLKDHVPAEAVQSYWDTISELESNPSLEITIALPQP